MTSYTWRQSVYFNRFKCNQCGERLCTRKGNPIEGKILWYETPEGTFGVCKRCRNTVCSRIDDVPDDLFDTNGGKDTTFGYAKNLVDKLNAALENAKSANVKADAARAEAEKVIEQAGRASQLEKRVAMLEHEKVEMTERFIKETDRMEAEIIRYQKIVQNLTEGGGPDA